MIWNPFRKASTDPSLKRKTLSADELTAIETARQVVDLFADEIDGMSLFEIRDVRTLPYGKDEVFKAVQIDITAQTDPNLALMIYETALFLPCFVEGVGPKPLVPMPPGLDRAENVGAFTADEISSALKEHGAVMLRHKEIYPAVEAERRMISEKLLNMKTVLNDFGRAPNLKS